MPVICGMRWSASSSATGSPRRVTSSSAFSASCAEAVDSTR